MIDSATRAGTSDFLFVAAFDAGSLVGASVFEAPHLRGLKRWLVQVGADAANSLTVGPQNLDRTQQHRVVDLAQQAGFQTVVWVK